MGYWEQKIVLTWQTVFLKSSIILCIFLILSCDTKQTQQEKLPYYNTANFTPQFIESDKEVLEKVKHTIGNFEMLDQYGKKITAKNIEGKIHVANFIFTSCGSICPIMTKNMKLVENTFGNDTNMVILSFSVTPWIDNVEKLNDYTKKNQITSKNWHFLTGNKAKIYELARKSYFAEEDLGFTKDSTDFLHTEHVLLIDNTKRIRGIYNGTLTLEIEQLVKDIKVLKN